jgi:hypothetical protein
VIGAVEGVLLQYEQNVTVIPLATWFEKAGC